ncbi:unnamed protein product [Gongylonema pulchrum]|uniref:Sulfhydryl oxidase n=1 Tax=Gongylonema pulchrum TaxID=637853 RepID=A0A183EL86_9BILA|nr:unnamed protein product [Gongylonema pulchrum]
MNLGGEQYRGYQFIRSAHLDLWTNTAFRIFLSIINDRGARNDVISVPQLIALIGFLSEISEHQTRLSLYEFLHPTGVTTLPHQLVHVADFIRNWELFSEAAVKPGSFNWNRRMLIHPQHTKSYEFTTFMALKYLGIELKIYDAQNGRAELVAWLRRTCKTEEGDALCPIRLWKLTDSKTADVQMLNNQKCPILIFASHFYIPMSTNILDTHNVFCILFKVNFFCKSYWCQFTCLRNPLRY